MTFLRFDGAYNYIKEKNRCIQDMILNILATAIPLLVLQFLILPGINSRIGEEKYGLVVTLVSVFTLITSTLAGTLNNVRLLMNEQYVRAGINGDFNIILVCFSVVTSIAVVLLGKYYIGENDVAQLIGLVVITILICFDGYYSVGFRIDLNYKRILVQKILLSIGYYIGYQLFLANGEWMLVYIVGYGFELPYLLLKTRLIAEPWGRTKLFVTVVKKESILIVSSLLNGMSTYVDKLILYPIIGGVITSTYYASTLMGKGISLMTFPISGVLLSYFAKVPNANRSAIRIMNIVGWIVGLISYGFCLLLSRPILGIIYPTIADEAMLYVPINLLSAVVGVQSTLLSPVVIRYCDLKWQIFISLINGIGYIVISLILLKLYGLSGFCIGTLVTSLLKYLIYFGIYKKECNKI